MTDFKIDTADDNVLWYVKGGGATGEERALRKKGRRTAAEVVRNKDKRRKLHEKRA